MILIITTADLAAPVPLTEASAASAGIQYIPGEKVILLKDDARQAAALAETVWLRDPAGKVSVVKSRKNIPNGTPVTLFNVAELFGVKIVVDP